MSGTGERLTLRWLGNASFGICYDDIQIFIDPVMFPEQSQYKLRRQLPLTAAELESADVILLTHHHWDHTAPETLSVLKGTDALFVCPQICLPVLDRIGIDRSRVRTVDYDQGISYEGVSIGAVGAIHPGAHGAAHATSIWEWEGPGPYLGAGYVLRVGRHSMFHPGDTVLLEEHYELKDVEILLLSICPRDSHLTALAEILDPKYIVPHHYDTYEITESNRNWSYGNPEETRSNMKHPERFRILEFGETFQPS